MISNMGGMGFLAASCLFALAACSSGSDDDSFSPGDPQADATPPEAAGDDPVEPGGGDISAIIGVWDATSLEGDVPLTAQRLFVIRPDNTLTDTSLSSQSNCYRTGIEVSVTPLGEDEYQLGSITAATMVVQGETMTYSYEERSGRETFEFPRVTGLSVEDVPFCTE